MPDDQAEDKCVGQDSFLHNVTLFYLKMHAKMQSIIEEFHTSSMADFFDKLKVKLLELNIPLTEIDKIIHSVNKEDLLKLYNKEPFRSDKTRKKIYKQHFDYIEPTQINLGADTLRELILYQDAFEVTNPL